MAERLYRFIESDAADFDEKARSLKVAFASETPVLRVGQDRDTLVRAGEEFYEVLDHAPENADLSELNDSGPFLDEHKEERQLGKVKSAKVDPDRISRAEIIYDEHALASERYGQMRTRTRPHISAGYRWKSIVGRTRAADGLPVYRFAWIADEISSVAIPADRKVGVGRGQVDSNRTSETKEQKFMDEPKVIQIDEAKIRSDAEAAAKKHLRDRKTELRTRGEAIVKDFPLAAEKVRSMVDEAVETDEHIEAVSFKMLREAGAIKPAKQITMADIGMSERDQKTYSLLRGIQSCIRRDYKGPDGLEGEVDAEMKKRNLGFSPSGFLVPADAKIRTRDSLSTRHQRDLQVNVFGQGGATVATELMTPIIELLRNKMVTQHLGVRSLAGLEGNIVIPRQTAAATAYSVSEIGALTLSTQALDQISLAPKRVGAYNQYSKQLLLQSSIDVENFIRDDLLQVIALDWDRLILNGQGAASEPMGIMNTPGISSVIFGGAATFANLVKFETLIATANADIGDMAYVTSPAAKGVLKSAAKTLVGATTYPVGALWDGAAGPGAPDGTINGYQAAATNQIPNNMMLFGVWSQCIHALWGGYDVVVNPYALDTQAEVRITVNTWGDVAVRHPQSFCLSGDSAAQ